MKKRKSKKEEKHTIFQFIGRTSVWLAVVAIIIPGVLVAMKAIGADLSAWITMQTGLKFDNELAARYSSKSNIPEYSRLYYSFAWVQYFLFFPASIHKLLNTDWWNYYIFSTPQKFISLISIAYFVLIGIIMPLHFFGQSFIKLNVGDSVWQLAMLGWIPIVAAPFSFSFSFIILLKIFDIAPKRGR